MAREGGVNVTATVGCPGILAGCVEDVALIYALVANIGACCVLCAPYVLCSSARLEAFVVLCGSARLEAFVVTDST